MRVYNSEINDTQISAAKRVMEGSHFRLRDVAQALVDRGVSSDGVSAGSVAGRAADRLLQTARRSGDIEHVKAGVWRAVQNK